MVADGALSGLVNRAAARCLIARLPTRPSDLPQATQPMRTHQDLTPGLFLSLIVLATVIGASLGALALVVERAL